MIYMEKEKMNQDQKVNEIHVIIKRLMKNVHYF